MREFTKALLLTSVPFVLLACQPDSGGSGIPISNSGPDTEFIAENEYSDGGVSDGGGNAVVCRDASGSVTSAELLDLYEIRHLNGRTPMTDTDPAENYFELALEGARRLESGGFGRGTVISRMLSSKHESAVNLIEGLPPVSVISEELETARTAMRILGTGVALNPVDDFSVVILPRGCHLEQAAVYRDHNNTLLIVGDIWNSFDDVNKAALLVHEAAYREMRNRKAKTSDLTRWLVGHAFSGYEYKSPTQGIPRSHLLCFTAGFGSSLSSSLDSLNSADKVDGLYNYVAIYDRDDDKTVYQFLRIDGENVYSKTTVTVARSLSPLAHFEEGDRRSVTEPLESSLMDGKKIKISLRRENGLFLLSATMLDARGPAWKETRMTCQRKN